MHFYSATAFLLAAVTLTQLFTIGNTSALSPELAKPAPTTVSTSSAIDAFDLFDGRTALLITDPQNDFLSTDGVAWGVVGESVVKNNTVQNLDDLFHSAKQADIPVFVSPHYYYPTDHGWHFEGTLEKLMHSIGMFDRKDALSLEGFEGSGADWLDQYKKYIQDGETVVSSPHKVYGPETNDMVLQLRKRGIDRVILGGMSANLCTESHMRELQEQGFEVLVVADATAAAITEELGDGYAAALVNFNFMANAVLTTNEVVGALAAKKN